jgi:hypothetical protein
MAEFTSNNDQPALHATNTGTGVGVFGQSARNDGVQGVSSDREKSGVTGLHGGGGNGVFGQSATGRGVAGISNAGVGVFGEATAGHGVQGQTNQQGRSGVAGINNGGGDGVSGEASSGRGVRGLSNTGIGVFGQSLNDDGVQGVAEQKGRSGVTGINSLDGNGVFGQSATGRGVAGTSSTGIGVFGESAGDDGVHGECSQQGRSGVAGIHKGGGNGIFGQGSPAGRFAGDVDVTGTIHAFDFVVDGGDCAEGFDVASGETFDPGSVMVFDDSGLLRECDQDYDRRVAGVISGAANHHPAILLGQGSTNRNRQPVALIGKVFCRVDANRSPIEVGDLLTTSKLPGHAMKAVDPAQAFGAVIGKAIGALASGQGLIPILVALQ